MFLSASYPSAPVDASLSTGSSRSENFVSMDRPRGSVDGETDGGCGSEEVSAVRSRRRISEVACCPVCSCTLRPGELHAHLAVELDRLSRLSGPPTKRRTTAPGTSSNGPSGNSDEVDTSGCTGSDVYERVKRNREKRLRACRGRSETVSCPVCGRRLSTTNAEAHVDACLRKSQSNDDDDESIDVEGEENSDEAGFGTSYEWCSQVRVRAAALQLLDGGEPPHGAMRVRRASTDTHLVVDGDEDVLLYGPPQYSPSRIAPQDDSMDFSSENLANASDSISNGVECGEAPTRFNNSNQGQSSTSTNNKTDKDSNSCYDVIVQALKSRIRELEQRLGGKNQRTETKCLICIGPYTEPVVSVQCWHVHCEACWLASLSAKKTCPQCNAITTAQHLRRIYI